MVWYSTSEVRGKTGVTLSLLYAIESRRAISPRIQMRGSRAFRSYSENDLAIIAAVSREYALGVRIEVAIEKARQALSFADQSGLEQGESAEKQRDKRDQEGVRVG